MSAETPDVNLQSSRIPSLDSLVHQASMNQIEFRVVEDHTLFIGLKHMLPEDILWRRDNPRVPAMICLQESNTCLCRFGCMTKLAQRCAWLFERLPQIIQIFVLFQRPEEGKLTRGAAQRAQFHKEDFAHFEKMGITRRQVESSEIPQVDRTDVIAFRQKMGLPLARRTEMPRVWSIYIPRNYKLRMFRNNYDSLQYMMRCSLPQTMTVPKFF